MSALRKHFFRAQQLAVETMDRSANKTAALSSELLEVEEQVKKLKIVYTDALKRVQESLPSYQHFKSLTPGTNVDAEKRLRKQTTWALGNTLVEGSSIVEESHFLFDILRSCGDTLILIAKQAVRFEYDLHEQVISKMAEILSEIKEIEILKKKLSRARLDMDSANSAVKRKQRGNEPDVQLIADAESAANQFHMAQDTYITALLSFASKELEHITPLQGLLSCQQRLYNDVSRIINGKLPNIQDSIQKTANSPVFGIDLEKHLEHTGKDVAIVLHKCCSSLLRSGVEQPGIFRLAGGLPQLRKLKAMFDSNRMEEEEWEQDVFTLAQAIKLYLRELPEPLLTFAMFEEWIACIGNPKIAQRVPRCKELIERLPATFQMNLQYLLWFLSQVAAKERQNKMGASNLGLVVGPNILRNNHEDDNESITALNAASALTELMISNYQTLFPDPLPTEVMQYSSLRSNTIPAPIVSSRPSMRAHKKGKAPPTPKRPANAPLPPPRVDLDKTPPVPAFSTGPETPTKPSLAPNPFEFSDDDDTPEPPKRSIDSNMNLNNSRNAPEMNPFHSPPPEDGGGGVNPFGENSVEDSCPIKKVGDDNPFNPFEEVSVPPTPEKKTTPPPEPSQKVVTSPPEVAQKVVPSPPEVAQKVVTSPPEVAQKVVTSPPAADRKVVPSPPAADRKVVPSPPAADRKAIPPPKPTKPKMKSSSSLDDIVDIDNTGSPTFTHSKSNRTTPTHSRNASNASNSSGNKDNSLKHQRTPSDSGNKPTPPPRLDK